MFPSFTPAVMMGNRHVQTIWPALLRRRPARELATEHWRLPDGDPLAIHFLDHRPGRPGVLVVHGLEGSANARYVAGLLDRLAQAGFNGAAFDFRTCGNPAALDPPARGLYHAGKTDDLAFVVERLRQLWTPAPLFAVGYSLGGNILLKWLGETGADNPLAGAVAISVPYDLGACAAAIDGPGFWSLLYRRRFMRTLRRKARAALVNHADRLDPAAIDACRTFADYDGAVIARVFGFASAQDYWARCSARGFLADIRRPTLLISSADDPFIPVTAIPRDVIAANPHLTLRLFDHGGHVGFVAGSPWRPRYIADDVTLQFLDAQVAQTRPRQPDAAAAPRVPTAGLSSDAEIVPDAGTGASSARRYG